MSTGACGINCDVCRLKILGTCSTCGSGRSKDGLTKRTAQIRILDRPCPILECAIENQCDYCPRDCERFPCDIFKTGPYPFSIGYLNMQERRRSSGTHSKTPSGTPVEVPAQYWEDLERRDLEKICKSALAMNHPPAGLILPCLHENLLVDISNRCLFRQKPKQLEPIGNPLLELLCLVYLLNASPEPLHHETISVHELKTGHFFRGPHELKTSPIRERYGNDLPGFRRAAESIGGDPIDMADAAYRFYLFPKVPLYYLIWEGDQEFSASVSVLFDRSVEHHLGADAIWGLVNLISDVLLLGDLNALFHPST